MRVHHRFVDIPDFGAAGRDGAPLPPPLAGRVYRDRCRQAWRAAGADWLAVYADREHFANLMFLTGFDPRFEEALLLLGRDDRAILITGNECLDYAVVSPLPGLEPRLAQTMSLMGQDRSVAPRLVDVLRDCGVARDHSVALVGWKYLEPDEWAIEADDEGLPSAFRAFVPAVIVAALARVAGRVVDRTDVLLHPETGRRSIIDADQIALFEAAATRASQMVWNIVTGIGPGDRECDAAARMGYAGEPFAVHPMLASSDAASGPVIGLRSPGARTIAAGDGVSTAIGLWGGLTARAGLVAESNDAFVDCAAGYFRGLARWYETVDLGVAGGEIHAAVAETLAQGGLRSMLNPGHLTGHEEWSNTPIRPGSTAALRSGMHIQVDIIPTPLAPGWALNCEDCVVLADATLRATLAERHPTVAARIDARRRFMRDTLGLPVADAILPLSATPGCLPPLWLRRGHLLSF